MLRVGLVGVGGISRSHIPAWDKMEDVELVALCDIRPERMTEYTDKHCYTDFKEMLDKENLDILDICLPTFLHADFACEAMNRGIHVLSEKPISLKLEDVERVYDTAKKNNVRFMVAQVVRFWPEFEYLKNVYDTKKYGRLLSGSMCRLGTFPGWSWDNWMQDEKRSGFVPYDLHIHDLDYMVYAFGAPKSVKDFRSKEADQDYIHAVYTYDDFFISVDCAWYAAPYAFRSGYRFQFEKAVLEYTGGKLTVYELGGKTFTPGQEQTAEQSENAGIPTTDAYAIEIRYFTDCVEKGVDADKVKPEELETVINILNSL